MKPTFRNPYTERIYRNSVTGLDEEIKYLQRTLVSARTYGVPVHRVGVISYINVRSVLADLLYLHRKRNALMK